MTEPIDIAARRKLLEAAATPLVGEIITVKNGPLDAFEQDKFLIRSGVTGFAIADCTPQVGPLIVAAVNDYGKLLDALAQIRRQVDIAADSSTPWAILSNIDDILGRTIR